MIVDLLVPALDEAANIEALFDAIEPLDVRRVIVADNGSSDDTRERAAERGALVTREPERGYGAACLRGMEAIWNDPPEVVVFLDADLSDDPAALPDLLAPIREGHADIVIGSRVRRAEPGALNVVQRFGNALACSMMRVLGGRAYSDLGPFRAVRTGTLRELDMQDRTWGWTVELQMKAALRGLRIAEVDVPYRRRHSGRSKISGTVRGVVTAGTKIITTIVAIWHRERRTG